MGFSSAGLDGGGGGAPHRSVFILARAPLVAEGRVTGVYKWRERVIYIYGRAARPHVQSCIVQVCRDDVYGIIYVNRTIYILII